jgi:hypothetical protein
MTSYSESSFEKKRLDALIRQSVVALPGNLLVAVCMVLLFDRNLSSEFLIFWLTAMVLSILARFLIALKYRFADKKSLNPKPWFIIYEMSIFFMGALWGVLGIYVDLHFSLVYLSITLMILAGLAAAAVSTNAVSKPAFLCFAFPMLAPLSVFLIGSGGFEHILLGVIVGVFLVVTTLSVFQINKVIRESLIGQFEKTRLMEALETEKVNVTELN